jgi:hypothetical protein
LQRNALAKKTTSPEEELRDSLKRSGLGLDKILIIVKRPAQFGFLPAPNKPRREGLKREVFATRRPGLNRYAATR